MFKELKDRIIARFFSTVTSSTVEQALSAFNKYVDNLQAIADANLRKVGEHALAAKEAQAAEKLAQAEADRAKLVAGKIKDLIGGV